LLRVFLLKGKAKGTGTHVQECTGREDSRRLRLSDFKTVGT